MCRSVAFFAWISCVHLIFPGTSILSSKIDTPAANATQKLLSARKSSLQDQTTSSSFNVFRGLYPHPHPLPHSDEDYPYSHQPPQAQPPAHGCVPCSQPNILVVPISGQYLNQPRVKHTIKTVITDMKEITTPYSDGSGIFGRNSNLSFNGGTKSSNREQEVQVVLPSDGYPPDDGIDLPFAGLEPIELEDNYVAGGQGFNPEKGFLFRPYGVFKPATAATLSAPGHKSTSPQVQPFSFPRPFTLPPFNLAYLRPRPLPPKDEGSQQWRPSAEISYGIPARHANVNIPKAAADPCGELEKEAKGTKVDSKL